MLNDREFLLWFREQNLPDRARLVIDRRFNTGFLRKVFVDQKSVVRAGIGVYFDRIGGPLTLTTAEFGSPGQTLNITSPAAFRLAEIPRFSGACTLNACSPVPNVSRFMTTPDPIQLPFVPQQGGPAALFVVDNCLRNPFTTHFNVSFQRELPGGFVVDVGYVGTFVRQLLTKADVVQFYGELKDQVSGQTMWGALNQIINRTRAELTGFLPFHNSPKNWASPLISSTTKLTRARSRLSMIQRPGSTCFPIELRPSSNSES